MVDLGLMKICGRCHLSAWGGSRKAFLSTLSGKETRHANHWPIQPAMRFLLNLALKPLFAILLVSCAAGWKFLKWGSRRLRGAFQSFCDQIMISLTYVYIYIYIYTYNLTYIITPLYVNDESLPRCLKALQSVTGFTRQRLLALLGHGL